MRGVTVHVIRAAQLMDAHANAKKQIVKHMGSMMIWGCVVKCLKHLHHELATPIIHRDVKPANTLLTEDLEAKVADFGESRHFDEVDLKKEGLSDMTMTMVGTPMYCAPEIIIGERYNKSVDVYSFGMLLLTLTLGAEIGLAVWFRRNRHLVLAHGKRPVKLNIPCAHDCECGHRGPRGFYNTVSTVKALN